MTYDEFTVDMSPAEVLGEPNMVLFMEDGGTNNFWHLSGGGMVCQDWDRCNIPYKNTLNVFSKEEVEKIYSV